MPRCYKSGKPTGGEPPGRQRVYTQVQPFDGTWKVTTLVVEKVGTCWPAPSSQCWRPGWQRS
jgi:hypothetical protein